jgi:hypothetical protein
MLKKLLYHARAFHFLCVMNSRKFLECTLYIIFYPGVFIRTMVLTTKIYHTFFPMIGLILLMSICFTYAYQLNCTIKLYLIVSVFFVHA